MKNLLILGIIFLAACSKSPDIQAPQISQAEKESCSFGQTEFNMIKRPSNNNEYARGKPIKNQNGGVTVSPTGQAVIYLDFNGHVTSGTMWNVYGDFTCSPAALTAEEISVIYERVSNDFSPFAVTVTTSESIYNSANSLKRIRVVITDSWEWYGQVGGVAYLNSFTWGDNTPCFVFSSLHGYNLKNIAEAASHEVGHTLGLRHQASFDANCVKLTDYNPGLGTGEISWAPIMGVGYTRNVTLWHNGANSISCTNFQNDVTLISGKIGFIADDYSNTTASAATLTGSLTAMINSSTDVDYFSVNLTTTREVSIIPSSVGINNSGSNLDLLLNVYNTQGVLLSTVNNTAILNASTTLAPGSYYLSVSPISNQFSTGYGMMGKYNISLN